MYLYEEKEGLMSESSGLLLEDVLLEGLLESTMENVLLSLGSIGENFELFKEAAENDSVIVLTESELAKIDEEAEDFYDHMRSAIKVMKQDKKDSANFNSAIKIMSLITAGLVLLTAGASFAVGKSAKGNMNNLPAVQGAKGGVGKSLGAAKFLKITEAVVGGLTALSAYITVRMGVEGLVDKLFAKISIAVYKSQFAKAKVKYAGYPALLAKIERGEKIIAEIEAKKAKKVKAAK